MVINYYFTVDPGWGPSDWGPATSNGVPKPQPPSVPTNGASHSQPHQASRVHYYYHFRNGESQESSGISTPPPHPNNPLLRNTAVVLSSYNADQASRQHTRSSLMNFIKIKLNLMCFSYAQLSINFSLCSCAGHSAWKGNKK